MNQTTRDALRVVPECEELGEQMVKGRSTPVRAWVVEVNVGEGRASVSEPGTPVE
jgi:hypothetical protein